MSEHIAFYHSNECSHIFSTSQGPLLLFPSSVFRFCSTCSKGHFFTRQQVYFVDTPKRLKACEDVGKKIGVVETNVDL